MYFEIIDAPVLETYIILREDGVFQTNAFGHEFLNTRGHVV
jgi:hypothetical protein